MNFEQLGQIVGWAGLISTAFYGIVQGVRALIRGPKEDKAVESEIQDRITAMAERWLERADIRLKETESRATEAEKRATEAEKRAAEAEELVQRLTPRVTELEHNLFSALNTIGMLWPWGLNGGGEPKPVLPAWIFEWLHKQGRDNV